MKNKLLFLVIGLILGLSVAVSAAILYNAKDIEFNPSDESWNVNNMQDALNDIKDNYTSNSELLGTVWEFDYTQKKEIYKVPLTGVYKLEVWGSQGGNDMSVGGYGGYSVGTVSLKKEDVLDIIVGGGNYNGAGERYSSGTCGGGATHIAKHSDLYDELSSYINPTTAKQFVYIVAGGGGGAADYANGGSGGGISGNLGDLKSGVSATSNYRKPGTQTSGYSFGKGGSAWGGQAPGGGGGWYGGYAGGTGNGSSVAGASAGGGGGSGFINLELLTIGQMYCYNCTSSTEKETYTTSTNCVSIGAYSKCSKSGNGYAKITLVSLD